MKQLGVYYPGQSFWHGRDPRSKFGVVLALMLTLLMRDGFAMLLGGVVVIGLYLSAGLPLAIAGQIIFRFKWLLLVTFLANLFFPQPIGLSWQTLQPSAILAGVIIFRLGMLLLVAMWLSLVTRPVLMVEGINRLLKPLLFFKAPIYDLSLVLMLVFRFIPELLAESETIEIAQRVRGIKPQLTWKTSQSWVQSTIIPLVIGSIRKSAAMAMAMEARGYRPGAPRSSMEELQLSWEDWLVMGMCFGLVVYIFLGIS